MSQHNVHLLPDGRPMVAEGHDLTAVGLQALADGYADTTSQGVWSWTFVDDEQ